MSEVKNEGLEVVDVRAIVTDAFISMMESALGMKAPDCAPPAFIQSAIDRAIDRINSEAIVGYAVRDSRIATQEAQIKALQSGENGWQSGYDEGRRMGGKHCALTIDQLRAELAALNAKLDASKFCTNVADDLRAELAAIKAQEPVAWEVYYSDDDSFHTITRDKSLIECYSKMAYTIKPLYAAPVAKQLVLPDDDELMQMAFEIGEPCEDATGYWFSMEDWEKFTIELRSRLNAADQEGDQDE